MTPEEAAAFVESIKDSVYREAQYRDLTLSTNRDYQGRTQAGGVIGRPNPNRNANISSLLSSAMSQYLVSPELRYGEVDIAQQEQKPENPGIRTVAFSTHGTPIPLSIGRRAITGNIVDASDIVPLYEGEYKYTIEYKIPIYTSGGGELS